MRALATRWLLLALATVAAATPLAPAPELRVGVPHLPPWAFHDADCRLTGIAVENLRRLTEHAGRRFVGVPLPLEAGAEDRRAAGVALFLGDPKLSADLEDTLPLPFGHTIDTIAVYQGPWTTAATALPSTQTVGARTQRLAESLGFADSRIVTGEVDGALADAFVAGRLDVLVGGREVIYVALMRRGWRAETLRSHARRLGSHAVNYQLTRQAEAVHGDALRRALDHFDWALHDRQLRQRFLSPEVARKPMLTPACESGGRRS
jgi:hypothetical protein